MENIVTITLLILTLFGKIEYKTFEIPNTREDYHGLDGISWSDSNRIVCSSWYERNVKIHERKKPKPFQNLKLFRIFFPKNIITIHLESRKIL